MCNSQNSFTLLYFAFLQEIKGKDREQRQLATSLTGEKLFEQIKLELQDQTDIALEQKNFRISINHEFSNFKTPIKADDIVAFIPPVAGG